MSVKAPEGNTTQAVAALPDGGAVLTPDGRMMMAFLGKIGSVKKETVEQAITSIRTMAFERFAETTANSRRKLPHASVDKLLPGLLKKYGIVDGTDEFNEAMDAARACSETEDAKAHFAFVPGGDSSFSIVAWGMVREGEEIIIAMAKYGINYVLGPASITTTCKSFLWFEWDHRERKNYANLRASDQNTLECYFKLRATRILCSGMDQRALPDELKQTLALAAASADY